MPHLQDSRPCLNDQTKWSMSGTSRLESGMRVIPNRKPEGKTASGENTVALRLNQAGLFESQRSAIHSHIHISWLGQDVDEYSAAFPGNCCYVGQENENLLAHKPFHTDRIRT